MIIEPSKPKPVPFGILTEYRKTSYGHYMKGVYKDYKIEIFNAEKSGQKLQYVSNNKTLKWIKSKLIYIIDGIKKINRSEAR